MANFTQDRMYQMLSDINRKQKPTYKKGGLTKYEPGGAWPPGLKLKNPMVSVMPYYQNALASGVSTPSFEIGLEGQMGKKKRWTVAPHIGIAYDANDEKDFPLTGGIDASYKGIPWGGSSLAANAKADMSLMYNPETGFGAGASGGVDFRLGRQSRRKGELKSGTASGNIMPYAGATIYQDPNKIAYDEFNQPFHDSRPSVDLVYGVKGGFEWRPKRSPVTFFGRGNINFGPATGKQQQSQTSYGNALESEMIPVGETWTVSNPQGDTWTGNTQYIENKWTGNKLYEKEPGLRFNPSYDFTIGAKMPLDRIKLSRRKPIPAEPIEEGEEIYPQDFTYKYKNEDDKFQENSPNFLPDWETRRELGETPFQQIDYNERILNSEDGDYKYGGQYQKKITLLNKFFRK